MQIIRSLGDAAAVRSTELRQLITDTFARVADCPEILGFVLVVEPGDTIAIIDTQLGFSILAVVATNSLWSTPDISSWFMCSGKTGTGIEVLVSKVIVALPELLAMCIEHALPPEPMP
jgi:hypothetical protein